MSGRVAATGSRGLAAKLASDPLHVVERAFSVLRARALLRKAMLGPRVGVGGRIEARIEGDCRIGARVTFRGGVIPTHLVVREGASLSIGEACVFNYGAFVEATREVRIGARCMFASMVRIADSDGDRAGPVVIGDDVWIAHGAIIQPDVTIGDGAVVSAGSVVTEDVPPRHIAAGNPARSAPLTLVSREETRAADLRLAE